MLGSMRRPAAVAASPAPSSRRRAAPRRGFSRNARVTASSMVSVGTPEGGVGPGGEAAAGPSAARPLPLPATSTRPPAQIASADTLDIVRLTSLPHEDGHVGRQAGAHGGVRRWALPRYPDRHTLYDLHEVAGGVVGRQQREAGTGPSREALD